MRRKLLLLGGGVLFALMVGEVAARVVLPLLPDPPGTAFVGDEACMYRLRPSEPGEFPEDHPDFINAFGFRDRNHSRVKPAGRQRVLGLGDSFVYGAVPPRDNFLRVAERKLNETTGNVTEILLMGIPGWSTENQVGYLKSEGLALEPDLVLVNFFVENDVTGIPVRMRIIRGQPYPTYSPLPGRNLLRRSHLFVMFESLVWRGMLKNNPAEAGAGPPPEDMPVNETYLKIVEHNLPVYRREPDSRTENLWREAIGYLEEIDEACRAAGVAWQLVLIPGEMQVDPAVRDQVLAGLAADPENYDFDAPQHRLVRWGEANEVPVTDLLPALRREHRAAGRLYVPNDTHWNTTGNEAAGTTLAVALRSVLNPAHE